MDITLIYAVSFGALVVLTALYHRLDRLAKLTCPLILGLFSTPLLSTLSAFLHGAFCQHLIYPAIVRRRKNSNRWSRINVLLLLMFFSANVVCLVIGYPSITRAGLRAGTLSLINMIILFAGPHLGFLADVLGVSVRTFRRFHVSAALVSLVLAIFHSILGVARKGNLSLRNPEDLFAIVVR